MDAPNAKFNLQFPISPEISSSFISISVQLPIWPAACCRRLPAIHVFCQFCGHLSLAVVAAAAADGPHTSIPAPVCVPRGCASVCASIREMQQSRAEEKRSKGIAAIRAWVPNCNVDKLGILGSRERLRS